MCEFHEPTDVYANGRCRPCHDEHQERYRRRVKLGTALLRAAEARGLSGGEAIALLQNAPYGVLQTCQSLGIK